MTRHDKTSEELLEQAMDWFLRLQGPSRSHGDEQDFAAWISRSPLHQQAWAKACRTWEVMGETIPVNLSAHQTRRRMTATRPRGFGKRKTIGIGLTALAACLAAIVAGPAIVMQTQADYMTQTAQTRHVTLQDGSTVELSAASAIAVDFSGTERRVKLLSGEAFFDVRTDITRPFTVDAGGELDITVRGTRFDVNVTPQRATVQLAHGAVDLSAPQTGEKMKLRPGDVISLDRNNGQLSKSSVNVDAIASWRDGKLFVQDVPISSVVAELQRYHPSWITVASGELGARRVTGLYDLSNPDRALEALVRPYGAKVHHVSPYLRVLTFL